MSVYLVSIGNCWGKHIAVEEAMENAMTAYGRPTDRIEKINIKEFDCKAEDLVMNGLGFEYPKDSKVQDFDIEFTKQMKIKWDRIIDLKSSIDEAMEDIIEPVYEVIYK